MEHVNILREYGLFDAKVPRYTSYPPANRFEPNVGARYQKNWLTETRANAPVSLYIHIPFCRRLCWFCACRTQGTRTLLPVDAYLNRVIAEIEAVTACLPTNMKMARLHLGGGTPTLLSTGKMNRLLDVVEMHFQPTADFEFSVEIDPTEAPKNILDLLTKRKMTRASIGVQDFDVTVQDAIGRLQSFEETRRAVEHLRAKGVESINIDLLYGLPHQTIPSLLATLDKVASLSPDRLALYGYAHVPHMSKRQTMIPNDALPTTMERFEASQVARRYLLKNGYQALGIDHFARASDSLAKAAQLGRMRRNFQGYTDDPCDTLIGIGASAISKFPQGYAQNAVSTAAYQQRVEDGGLAGHKGYVLTSEDAFISDAIDQIMCDGAIDGTALARAHPPFAAEVPRLFQSLTSAFPKALTRTGSRIAFQPGTDALARIVAAHLDAALQRQHLHSVAI